MVRVATINFLAAALLSVCTATPTDATLEGRSTKSRNPTALYFLVNNDTANAIRAIPVRKDGTLTNKGVTTTLTGGRGGSVINIFTGKIAGQDALNTANSLIREGNYLFTVNAGSNTISMFKVDSNNPTSLSLVGKPVSSLGDFPSTIAASSKINQVCTANTGARAGVSCFSYSSRGISPDGVLRPYNLNQTNPPVGFPNTVGGMLFNADSTAVYTTVKAGLSNITSGFFSVFPVEDGKVSTKEIRTSPAGSNSMFGGSNLPGTTDIIVADGLFGALRLEINQNWTTTTIFKTIIPGQGATCWTSLSDTTGTTFLSDGFAPHIYEIDQDTGNLIKSYSFPNNNTAYFDTWVGGNYLYALNPQAQTTITVIDISKGRGMATQIQEYVPKDVTIQAQGMLAWD